MIQAVFLDSGLLGLATQRQGIPLADTCRTWVDTLTNAGIRVIVPEIADYEVRRELIRAGRTAGLKRLDMFLAVWPYRYLPIDTPAIRRAAELWAEARNKGYATADPKALDADVIVAAQALTAGYAPSEIIVATDNVAHLSRYVPAEDWQKIAP
jgi:predicted nucleic acid-binding protein